MELISTHICKASEIGIHSNMFGGNILAIIDEAAASYSAQICDTPRIVTVKIDELVFKQPVKVGNILKIYGEVKRFGTTSITLYSEVRKHTHTQMTFVRIDDEGNPLAISERVKLRYADRIKEFGRGLLTPEEIAIKRALSQNRN